MNRSNAAWPLLVLMFATSSASAQNGVGPPGEAVIDPEDPPEVVIKPARESLALRVGFVNSGLFDSGQGRPFIYLDFGLRYKASGFYIDVKFPALVAGLDFASYQLQQLMGINKPFSLLEAFNDPIHYAAYLEPAHVRLGQTFDTALGNPPLQLSAGIFSLFDFAFLDLTRRDDDRDTFEDIDDPSAIDPFFVVVGGFGAVGGKLPYTAWDLALGVGWDVYQNSNYEPAAGAVIYVDLDIQIDPLASIGGYFRWRLSTYTHLSPLPWTMALGYGAALKLF